MPIMPMPLLLSLSLIFFIVAIACIGDKIEYEQHTSKSNKYLWMVSLRLELDDNYNSSDIQLCGGSLIRLSPYIILTAAHCFDFLSFNKIDGTIIDSNNQIVHLYADLNRTYWNINTVNDYTLPLSAFNIYIHPKWQTGQYQFGYDIALIIFDYFVVTSKLNHQTLLPKLSGSNDYDDDYNDDNYTQCCLPNEQLISIGYDKNSDELRSTNLNYVCKLKCSATAVVKRVLRRFNTDENIVEVLEEHEQGLNVHINSTGFYDGRIICVSDNNNNNNIASVLGGPLFRITNKGITEIIGIISFDGNCNTNDTHDKCPSFCTNITSYYNWIQTTINFELLSKQQKKRNTTAFTDDDHDDDDDVLIIIKIVIVILIGALLLICGCLIFILMNRQQFVQPFIQIIIQPKYDDI